jgi:hypothetical protein
MFLSADLCPFTEALSTRQLPTIRCNWSYILVMSYVLKAMPIRVAAIERSERPERPERPGPFYWATWPELIRDPIS